MTIEIPNVLPEPSQAPKAQVQAGPEAFGGGQELDKENQQVQSAAAALGEIGTFEKLRADQTASMVQYNDAVQKIAPLEAQFTDVKGLATHEAYGQTIEKINKIVADNYSQLKNPLQQAHFGELTGRALDGINAKMQEHMYGETEKAQKVETDSAIGNTIALSAQNGNIAGGLKNLDTILQNKNKSNGVDENSDTAIGERLKFHGEFHFAQLQSMVDNQNDLSRDTNASSYLDYYKKDMDSETYKKASDLIDKATPIVASARAVTDALQKANGDPQRALSIINKMPENTEIDVKTKDEAKKRLVEAGETSLKLEAQAKHQLYNQALDTVSRAQQRGAIIPGKTTISDIVGTKMWTRLEPAQQSNLEHAFVNVQGDDKAWLEFSHMTPEQIRNLTPEEQDHYTSRFGIHAKEGQALLKSANGNKALALQSADRNKLIFDSAGLAGIIPKDKGTPAQLKGSQIDSYKAFNEDVLGRIQTQEDATGKKVTRDEAQKIIDQKVIETIGSQSRGWFASTPVVTYEDIPEQAKEHILTYARQFGKPITKEEMETAYQYYQAKDIKGLRKVLQ